MELIHDNGTILVPQQLWESLLEWYHLLLVHPGEKRVEPTRRVPAQGCAYFDKKGQSADRRFSTTRGMQ